MTHDGTGTTFTFTDNGTPFLVLAVRLDRSEDGSVTRASLAADGDTIQHRITFDFADDPGRAFSEGKLQAVVSVEGQPGDVHRGHFDGQTWQLSGLDDAPVLPRLLAQTFGSRLAPFTPALQAAVVNVQERSGMTFSATNAPVIPASFERFSFRERFCKMGWIVAHIAADAGCCSAAIAAANPEVCVVCHALAAVAAANCIELCTH